MSPLSPWPASGTAQNGSVPSGVSSGWRGPWPRNATGSEPARATISGWVRSLSSRENESTEESERPMPVSPTSRPLSLSTTAHSPRSTPVWRASQRRARTAQGRISCSASRASINASRAREPTPPRGWGAAVNGATRATAQSLAVDRVRRAGASSRAFEAAS